MHTTDRTGRCAGSAPLWAYKDQPGGSGRGADVDSEAETESSAHEDRAVLCRSCRARVTSSAHAVEVNGGQQHTFFNPSGILFEIGCFKEAEGCLVAGDPTTEFSWFSGYAWQYALCSSCRSHLGWRFEGSAGSAFFGLILKHLIQED